MAIEYVPYNLTDEQVRELWDRYSRGETAAALGDGSARPRSR
jgi:hypothetical protein